MADPRDKEIADLRAQLEQTTRSERNFDISNFTCSADLPVEQIPEFAKKLAAIHDAAWALTNTKKDPIDIGSVVRTPPPTPRSRVKRARRR